MNILKGLGKLIFSLDLKVNYQFFFCCQKECNSTKLSVRGVKKVSFTACHSRKL